MTKILSFLISFVAFSHLWGATTTITLSKQALELSNGSAVAKTSSSPALIGGYSRWVGKVESFSKEVLLKGAIPSTLGTVKTAQLKITVKNSNLATAMPLALFEVDKNWSGTPLYTDFDWLPWKKPLSVVNVKPGTSSVTYTFEGAGLVDLVERWRSGATNNGVVLSASFGSWVYSAEVSSAQLFLEEYKDGIDEKANAPIRSDLAMAGSFSFPRGNLLPNWSFEQDDETWTQHLYPSSGTPEMYDDPSFLSISGRKVLKYTSIAPYGTNSSAFHAISPAIPVQSGQNYTFWWHWKGIAQTAHSVVEYSNRKDFSQILRRDVIGNYAVKSSNWKRERFVVNAPIGAEFARIVLVEGSDIPLNQELYFDDLILELGDQKTYPEVLANVAYGDGAGLVYQQHSLIQSGGASSLVSEPCLGNQTLFASQNISVGRQSYITGGISALQSINFADESRYYASAYHAQTPTFTTGARVNLAGDIYRNSLTKGSETRFDANFKEYDYQTITCQIPQVTVNNGTLNVTQSSGTKVLTPGAYGNITSTSTASATTLSLSAGDYDLNSLNVGNDGIVQLDLSKGSIIVRTKNLTVGDRVKVVMSDVRAPGAFVIWQTSQTTDVNIGYDTYFQGVVQAPNANIVLKDRSLAYGTLLGKNVNVGENAAVWMDAEQLNKGPGLWSVSGSTFDSKLRPEKQILGYVSRHEGYEPTVDALTGANTWYNGSTTERPNAGGYAYSTVTYDETEMGTPVQSARGSGLAWQATGADAAQGQMMTTDLNIPSIQPEQINLPTITDPYNQLVLSTQSTSERYNMSWSRDNEGTWNLSWTNRSGQVLKTAQSRVAFKGSNWNSGLNNWAISTTEYNDVGTAKMSKTPLDNENGTSDFATTVSYDENRSVNASFNNEKGLNRTWTDELGRVRFSQTQGQMSRNVASYVEFDEYGRSIATGETQYAPTQALANLPRVEGQSQKKEVLSFYGQEGWNQVVSSYPFLASIQPKNLMVGGEAAVAMLHLNPDFDAPGLTSDAARVVANVYSYDSIGRKQKEYLYVGIEKQEAQKIHHLEWQYDAFGRILSESYFMCLENCAVSSQKNYRYDSKGRLEQILDKDGNNIEKVVRNDQDRLVGMTLANGLTKKVTQNIKGWTLGREVRAADGKLIWSQKLAYEQKLNPSTPAPARLDGKVVQAYEDMAFSGSSVLASSPSVQMMEFKYSGYGAMQEKRELVQNNPVRGSDGSAQNPTLSEDLSKKETWDFDKNGRVSTRTVGNNATLSYDYLPKSYKLDHIENGQNLSSGRDVSQENTFIYDEDGRLVFDGSKLLEIRYGLTGAVELTKHTGVSTQESEHTLYGPDGWRVAEVLSIHSTQATGEGEPQEYERIAQIRTEHRLASQVYGENTQNFDGIGNSTEHQSLAILGMSGRVGRELTIGYTPKKEYYVKNHQGSVVAVVDAYGVPVQALRYSPYGVQNYLLVASSSPLPEEQYTGKRLSETTGLYYFGARYYDADLGLWTSHDPAGQYMNPYGFGNNPFMDYDPNGLWKWGVGLVIGYDSKSGFSMGFGVAAQGDVGIVSIDADLSATKSFKDDSWTYSANAGAAAKFGIVNVDVGLGASYNTVTGSTWSTHGGANIYGVGIEVGTTSYYSGFFDDYQGSTVYAELNAKAGPAKAGVGHEWGFGGARGRAAARGWYAYAGAMGVNAQISENHGFSYGGSYSQSLYAYNSNPDPLKGERMHSGVLADAASYTKDLYNEAYDQAKYDVNVENNAKNQVACATCVAVLLNPNTWRVMGMMASIATSRISMMMQRGLYDKAALAINNAVMLVRSGKLEEARTAIAEVAGRDPEKLKKMNDILQLSIQKGEFQGGSYNLAAAQQVQIWVQGCLDLGRQLEMKGF